MNAGKLNQRVEIFTRQVVQDPLGGEVVTWVKLCEISANVRFMNGAESILQNGILSVRRASIRIRNRAGILPTQRIIHQGEIYNIAAVLPDNTGRHWLDLACETGGNDG